MPKQPPKTKEEKLAENFFPLKEESIKQTTEKEIKEPGFKENYLKHTTEKPAQRPPQREELLRGTIEKAYKKPELNEIETVEYIEKTQPKKTKIKTINKKRVSKRKSPKTKIQKVSYSIPKISLKKSGYELIITEKPQAATKIATSLGDATQRTNNKVSYYEVDRNGKKIIVACAVGHLFTLKQNNKGFDIPIFDISWLPNYLARKKDFTKRYYDTILKLAKGAGSITVATDFDIEGEVIGWNVVRFLCGQKNAKRMKFSTLTKDELNKAYEQASNKLNWGQAYAGETRHYLDWFYGINLSRALMNAIKTTGKFRIMSIGRVQGPALNLIVKREKEIQAFNPEPYWQVFISVDDNKNQIELKHVKDLFNKKECDKFKDLIGKTCEVDTKKKEQSLPPNPPFDLTTLQTEAYKFHGIPPSATLRAAQSLYLTGLISYPRTSSQKLPESIGYKEILKKLAKQYKVEHLIKNQKPIEGKKEDPAHPSIYPTGNTQILSGDEEKIYSLIIKRFLSLFCENALIENKTITAEVNKLKFRVTGREIIKKAWLEIYPSKAKEIQLPDMNGQAKIIDSKIEEKETQPQKRYSPASILSMLEKKNLGTKATRANILETLYDRGYVKDQSIKATPLGISLISTLEKYSPIIIDEKLTREFENEMESIQKIDNKSKEINNKKDFVSKKGSRKLEDGWDNNNEQNLKQLDSLNNYQKKEQSIINKAKKTITKISDDFKKNEARIGGELLQANLDFIEQQKVENTLTKCPVCKKGSLAITYSKKNRRHFVACNAYPECKTTFSLPPNGVIKKTDQVCEECSFPKLMRLQKGKRPWIFCFNTSCKTNKERVEKYEKEKEGD